ncbi:MAG: PilZ domain-containing protein [Gammaproteobacteria bacterium]|nr:PilZ domain-containing protein [Gammaproteobacteria bacterium]
MENERRLYPRFNLATQLNVIVAAHDLDNPVPYRVADFSRGGMRLEAIYENGGASRLMSEHDALTIRFGRDPSGEVEARAIRVSASELGIEFEDPDSKVLDRLHGDVMKHVSREEARRQVRIVLDKIDDGD